MADVLYLWVKVFHIAAVISWMAGLLYLPRLFVYHADAEPGGEAARTFKVMERRLLVGIMYPAAVASLLAGGWLAWEGQLWQYGWFQAKLGLVCALVIFHFFLARCVRNFQLDQNIRSGRFYRIINEIPAVLMLGIVIFIVVRP